MSDDRRFYIAILAGIAVGAVLIAIGEVVEWLKRRTQDAMLYEQPDVLTRAEKRAAVLREEVAKAMRVITTTESPCCLAPLDVDGEGIWSDETQDYSVRLVTYSCSKCGNNVEVDA